MIWSWVALRRGASPGTCEAGSHDRPCTEASRRPCRVGWHPLSPFCRRGGRLCLATWCAGVTFEGPLGLCYGGARGRIAPPAESSGASSGGGRRGTRTSEQEEAGAHPRAQEEVLSPPDGTQLITAPDRGSFGGRFLGKITALFPPAAHGLGALRGRRTATTGTPASPTRCSQAQRNGTQSPTSLQSPTPAQFGSCNQPLSSSPSSKRGLFPTPRNSSSRPIRQKASSGRLSPAPEVCVFAGRSPAGAALELHQQDFRPTRTGALVSACLPPRCLSSWLFLATPTISTTKKMHPFAAKPPSKGFPSGFDRDPPIAISRAGTFSLHNPRLHVVSKESPMPMLSLSGRETERRRRRKNTLRMLGSKLVCI